jgi:hypothetical protein
MRTAVGWALAVIGALCLYSWGTIISSKVEFANGVFESLKDTNKSIAANAPDTLISELSDFNDVNAVSALPISYRLVRGGRYNRSETDDYDCRNTTTWEALDNRPELPASNPFDFNSFFKTRLNILVMGDSMAVQFGSWLQTAGGATNRTVLVTLHWRKNGLADGLVAAPVQGGGSVAYWRMLGFWETVTATSPLPNYGRGWRTSWVQMLHDSYPTQGDKCNVLIFRLSHPWLSTGEVNEGRLNETLEVARSHLGQELIVIFQTAAFNNNVVTSEDLINFRAMNDVVRSFVTKLNASDVLLSDVELYMYNVIEWNAKQLGMDTTNATSYLLERLAHRPRVGFPQHIAQACSERVTPNHRSCQHNMLSSDGMHFCMESLGSRMFANSACLIQCAYDKSRIARDCERGCNEKFFRLVDPIPGIVDLGR